MNSDSSDALSASVASGITALQPHIARHILALRDQRVMLDADLAALYGVETKVLVQTVKRNSERFPGDFMFQLDAQEWASLRSQFVTSNTGRGGRRYAPYAFTEHGAIQAANVLASAQAVEMGIYVVRAFVHLREALATNADVAKRLAELEMKTESLELSHDTFSRNTRLQLRQLLDAVRELTTPPEPPKRPIGFVTPEDKKA